MEGLESLKRGRERLAAKVLCGTVTAKALACRGFQHRGITAKGGSNQGNRADLHLEDKLPVPWPAVQTLRRSAEYPQEECRIPSGIS